MNVCKELKNARRKSMGRERTHFIKSGFCRTSFLAVNANVCDSLIRKQLLAPLMGRKFWGEPSGNGAKLSVEA